MSAFESELLFLQADSFQDPATRLGALQPAELQSLQPDRLQGAATITIHPVAFRNYWANSTDLTSMAAVSSIEQLLRQVFEHAGVFLCAVCSDGRVEQTEFSAVLNGLKIQKGVLIVTVEAPLDMEATLKPTDIFDFFAVSGFVFNNQLYRAVDSPPDTLFNFDGVSASIELVIESVSLPLSEDKQRLLIDLFTTASGRLRLRTFVNRTAVGEVSYDSNAGFICQQCRKTYSEPSGELVLNAGGSMRSLSDLLADTAHECAQLLAKSALQCQSQTALTRFLDSLTYFGLATKPLSFPVQYLSTAETIQFHLACFNFYGFRDATIVLPELKLDWQTAAGQAFYQKLTDFAQALNAQIISSAAASKKVPGRLIQPFVTTEADEHSPHIEALIESWQAVIKHKKALKPELVHIPLDTVRWQQAEIAIQKQALYVVRGSGASGKSCLMEQLVVQVTRTGDSALWKQCSVHAPAFSRSRKTVGAVTGITDCLVDLITRSDSVRKSGLDESAIRACIQTGAADGSRLTFLDTPISKIGTLPVQQLFPLFWEHAGAGDMLGALVALGLSEISLDTALRDLPPEALPTINLIATCNRFIWAASERSRQGYKNLLILDGGFDVVPVLGQRVLVGLLQQLLSRGLTVLLVSNEPFFAFHASAVIETQIGAEAGRQLLSYRIQEAQDYA